MWFYIKEWFRFNILRDKKIRWSVSTESYLLPEDFLEKFNISGGESAE